MLCVLQDKDLQVQKLQEKCEKQSRNLTSLEERCASLKTTIDNLNSALERASGSESDLRKEIAALQKSLLEANSNTSTSNEKLKQLQKSQTNIENERRLLVERLEANQLALTDLRRANQALQDQMQRLQTDLANNEVKKKDFPDKFTLKALPFSNILFRFKDQVWRLSFGTPQRLGTSTSPKETTKMN